MKCVAKLLVVLGILTVGLMVAAQPAQALVFNLTSDHCTGGCGPAGTIFGTVTVLQSGPSDGTGTVDITVHLNNPPYAYAKTGAADDQAFKFNASGVLLTDITVDVHVPGLVAATGAFNGDGTGNFSFGINCPSCGGGGSSSFTNDIVFHIANATIADLTATNNLGNVFVADVINTVTGNTGPVDATVATVAEPGSLLLVGSGMALAGILSRRRKRQ
jgi:hypothetical protein